MIHNIQAVRFFAALSVAFLHAAIHYFNVDGFILAPLLAPFREFGIVGVDVFFVVSGFIMWHTTHGKDTHPLSALEFFVRRAGRIFINYWPWLIISLLVVHFWQGKDISEYNYWTSITLLSGSGTRAVPVSWTLTFELMFYLGFAVCLLLPRKLSLATVVVWGVVSLVVVSPSIWLSPFVAQFSLGVALCAFIGRFGAPPLTLSLGVAVLALFCGTWFYTSGDHLVRALCFGPFGAGIIAAAIRLEEKGIVASKALVFAGNASYALYLCHIPVYIFFRTFWRSVIAYPDLMFGGMIVAAVIVSLLWFQYYEKGANEWLKGLISELFSKLKMLAVRPAQRQSKPGLAPATKQEH